VHESFQLTRLLRTAPLSRMTLRITPVESQAILVGSFRSTALMTTWTFDVLRSPFTGAVTRSSVGSLYALPDPTFRDESRMH